ncbi:MAG: hypothetical protein HY695_13270 [Deltaproteobacteria bacterium]|nr:hypothetical protein [Deltaproteobacteria bacterium]
MREELIEIIDPTAEREVQIGTIAGRGGELQGKRVGLLDNSKPNADQFLNYLGQSLRDRYPGVEVLPKRKMTRTEADCLPELVEKCDLVINAFAD